jgi:hypothetical protein
MKHKITLKEKTLRKQINRKFNNIGNADEDKEFFNWPNPSSCTMALGSTQPLTKRSTKNLSGGKGRLMRKADNLTTIVSWLSRKCGSLDLTQTYGPSRAVTGIALATFSTCQFSPFFPTCLYSLGSFRVGNSSVSLSIELIILTTHTTLSLFSFFPFMLHVVRYLIPKMKFIYENGLLHENPGKWVILRP